MKKCEICDSLAKMYCESDQANLCWDCDAKVHCANFLVAKHSRTLLCHLCQSFTPWTASGPKLSLTVSVCENCVNNSTCREESGNGGEQSSDGDDDDDDDVNREDDSEDDENGDGGDEDEEEEENQVVPWSSTAPSPPASSSSSNSNQECSSMMCNSNEGCSQSRITAFSLKRMRETTAEQASQDHRLGCLLSQDNLNACMSNELAFQVSSTLEPLKDQTTNKREYLTRDCRNLKFPKTP
ncbi:hypothetical protein P3X46_033355 [Hevea brasiliensis]|uniref:B box-type domain-containing protein n=1 Tax=Hevea brasiliensis TaxID=3981 RepID=A0ABQ9KG82_HEVBR|nr:zinc finger protein CONSTANS-LIKE 4 isoform X2 [Hevea brasiliensis]KAJ9136263.1 hypothetical protein P3X46_033355 [Hevea brasiliensis]